jgi:hypothetical protein
LSTVPRAPGTNHFATVGDTVLLLKTPRGATPGVQSDPKHRHWPRWTVASAWRRASGEKSRPRPTTIVLVDALSSCSALLRHPKSINRCLPMAWRWNQLWWPLDHLTARLEALCGHLFPSQSLSARWWCLEVERQGPWNLVLYLGRWGPIPMTHNHEKPRRIGRFCYEMGVVLG